MHVKLTHKFVTHKYLKLKTLWKNQWASKTKCRVCKLWWISYTAKGWNACYTRVWKKHSKRVIDDIFRPNPLLQMLRKRGQIVTSNVKGSKQDVIT